MLGVAFQFDGDTIELERRVDGLLFSMGKDNFNCLLNNVRVKFHFPLARPACDFIQVTHELILSILNVSNFDKKGGVIRK